MEGPLWTFSPQPPKLLCRPSCPDEIAAASAFLTRSAFITALFWTLKAVYISCERLECEGLCRVQCLLGARLGRSALGARSGRLRIAGSPFSVKYTIRTIACYPRKSPSHRQTGSRCSCREPTLHRRLDRTSRRGLGTDRTVGIGVTMYSSCSAASV